MSGKVTKTEWMMVALAAAFLLVLAVLYAGAADAAAGTDYTISVQRAAAEPVTPEISGIQESQDPINLNAATAEELEKLDGVGPVLAGRIIEYREEHGPFPSVEALLEVKGIGEATLARFREDVTVEPADAGTDETHSDSEEEQAT